MSWLLSLLAAIFAVIGVAAIALTWDIGNTDGDLGGHIIRWLGVGSLALAGVCVCVWGLLR